MSAPNEPLALDLLLSEDERRPLSVAGHHEWRESLAVSRPYDEIDEWMDTSDFAPSQNKSSKEISRLLNLLDNLPRGKDSE